MDAMTPGAQTPRDDGRKQPSEVRDKEALFQLLKKQISGDLEKQSNWRMNAAEEFAFVTGPGQWSTEDRAILKEQGRPVVTFNETLNYIKAICGLEANNRRQIAYLPRDVTNEGEVEANELLSVASDWMADGCDAASEQSRAFRDTTICGMGWTEALIEYDEDPQGAYSEGRCDPLEMFWDSSCRNTNLRGSKRRGRVRKMRLEEARNLIPGVTDAKDVFESDLDASWAVALMSKNSSDKAKTREEKELREENTIYNEDTEVHVVQVQWWEYEPYFRTVDLRDPSGKTHRDVSADQMKALEAAAGQELPKASLRRKVYKQAFLGSKVLWVGDCPDKTGFTFNCMTWEPDDSDGTWFGLVRLLRDPQTWSNKFFAQLMHMINSTAKGGIMAEEDAFTDIKQAQATWASPTAITVVQKGALTNGKIQPKPGGAVTGGVIALMEAASAAFSKCSGINLELLGLADRDQAGVLEAQRKQAAMTILATLFDGYGGFHKDVGRTRLYFVQEYLADDRLIRIKGGDGFKVIQLLRDKMMGRYDVVVDDAPSAPNVKQRAWASLQPIMPLVAQSKEAVAAMLDYIPDVPERLVLIFKKILSAPNPAAEQTQQLQIAGEQAQVQKDQASAEQSHSAAVLNMARAASEQARSRQEQFGDMLTAAVARRRKGADIPHDQVIMGSANTVAPQLSRPQPQLPPPLPPPLPQQQPQTQGIVPPGGI